MDEQNQMQNPNMSMPSAPSGGSGPMGQMPPIQSMPSMPAKGRSMLMWVIIAIALVVTGVAWWYISQIEVEPMVQGQPNVDKEAREDMMINKDIQEADSVNIDSEFKTVDNDINTL